MMTTTSQAPSASTTDTSPVSPARFLDAALEGAGAFLLGLSFFGDRSAELRTDAHTAAARENYVAPQGKIIGHLA